MLSAALFARAAALLQVQWPQLILQGPGPWELAVRRTPFGEVRLWYRSRCVLLCAYKGQDPLEKSLVEGQGLQPRLDICICIDRTVCEHAPCCGGDLPEPDSDRHKLLHHNLHV